MGISLEEFEQRIARALSSARVLLIVPPFDGLDHPSLALHLLQAAARRQGFEVDVLYANLALAALIGESDYSALCNGPLSGLYGERFFSHVAYGKNLDELFAPRQQSHFELSPHRVMSLPMSRIRDLAQNAATFVEQIAKAVVSRNYRVVGCTTTFEQTAASIGILNAIKRLRPAIHTLLGGGNCEGQMAEGMASLARGADFIFTGESESSFPQFLKLCLDGHAPATRIIRGEPMQDLDGLAEPDLREYFDQMGLFLPASRLIANGDVWLTSLSSRGCWWGEKHRCTFCGINGEEIAYRKKSPDVVFAQIVSMLERYPSRNVFMVDSIMPRSYFKTLLPRLESIPGLNLFYEQKANLSEQNIVALKRAGVNLIQPGIESLSTPLLQLMNKGVTARQNLDLMRHARTHDLALNWHLLYDFPGDRAEYYRDMLAMIPHIVHLHPPSGLFFHILERFSTYFRQAADYGISNIRPMPTYHEILPHDVDAMTLAYHFDGDYDSCARREPELIEALRSCVASWTARWVDFGVPPTLAAVPLDGDSFMVLDSRYEYPFHHFLTREQTRQLLTEVRTSDCDPADYDWLLSRHLMLEVDGYYVPIVTTRWPQNADPAPGQASVEPSHPERNPIPVVTA